MTNMKLSAKLLTMIFCCFFVAVNMLYAQTGDGVEETAVVQLENIARHAILSQNNALLDPHLGEGQTLSQQDVHVSQYENAMASQIQFDTNRRAFIAQYGEYFVHYETELTTLDTSIAKDKATLKVKEYTAFERFIAEEDTVTPLLMEEVHEHLLTYHYHDEMGWVLVYAEVLNQPGSFPQGVINEKGKF